MAAVSASSASVGASIGASTAIMAGLNVSEETIKTVTKLLEQRAQDLEEKKPHTKPVGAFGGSPYASALAQHTVQAQDQVIDAVLAMVAGLRGFGDSLVEVQKDHELTDEEIGSNFTVAQSSLPTAPPSLPEALTCASGTDFTAQTVDSNTCALPTEETDR